MEKLEKEKITQKAKIYVRNQASQNAAARTMEGVSEATISQVVNGNWKSIKDEMWRKIASQVGYEKTPWQHADTRNHKLTTRLLIDTHRHHQVCAIVGDGGVGKTHAFKQYAMSTKGVVWLRCEKYWTQKHLLSQMLQGMGYNAAGMTLIELIQEITKRAKARGDVLIIFDQFNKLRDGVKDLIIPLYNELEDNAGFFIAGTSHLKTSFRRGVRLNKEGYQEMYSRMGRKFVELKTPTSSDVRQICYANGVESKEEIASIFDDSEEDLRRVRRKIHGFKILNNTQHAA